METKAASVAAIANRKLGDAVTVSGEIVYALLDFDIALYPRGFQSQAPLSANMAVFLRSDISANPVGTTFTFGSDTYTISQVLPEESDTNSIAVLFE